MRTKDLVSSVRSSAATALAVSVWDISVPYLIQGAAPHLISLGFFYPILCPIIADNLQYKDFFNQLQVKRAALVEAQAGLESVEEAIAAEPQLLTLERAIFDDAIFALLARNPSDEVVASLPQLTVQDQVMNGLYSSLKSRMIALRSSVAVFSAEIINLNERTVKGGVIMDR